jgi:hypothetical protein
MTKAEFLEKHERLMHGTGMHSVVHRMRKHPLFIELAEVGHYSNPEKPEMLEWILELLMNASDGPEIGHVTLELAWAITPRNWDKYRLAPENEYGFMMMRYICIGYIVGYLEFGERLK